MENPIKKKVQMRERSSQTKGKRGEHERITTIMFNTKPQQTQLSKT